MWEGNGIIEAAWLCAKSEMCGETGKVCAVVHAGEGFLQHQDQDVSDGERSNGRRDKSKL